MEGEGGAQSRARGRGRGQGGEERVALFGCETRRLDAASGPRERGFGSGSRFGPGKRNCERALT